MERPSLEPSVEGPGAAAAAEEAAVASRFSDDVAAWPVARNGTCERSMVPFNCGCGCGAACACASSVHPRLQCLSYAHISMSAHDTTHDG